jgi:hypothetical protein
VYAVSVGNDRYDLVIGDELGRGTARLTQNQGSNTYPRLQLGRPSARVLLDAERPGRHVHDVAQALHDAASDLEAR